MQLNIYFILTLYFKPILSHHYFHPFFSDLKLKDVELVTTYREWTKLLEKMSQNQCHGCIKLEEHLKLAKEIKTHKDEVYELQFQMSDDALQQMPDFQGRVPYLSSFRLCLKRNSDSLFYSSIL